MQEMRKKQECLKVNTNWILILTIRNEKLKSLEDFRVRECLGEIYMFNWVKNSWNQENCQYMTDIDYQYSKDVYNTEKQVFVGNMVEMDITQTSRIFDSDNKS